MKLLGLLGATIVALGASVASAGAAPFTAPARDSIAVTSEPMLEKTHGGGHARCAWDGGRGWHFHGPLGAARHCRPARPGGPYTWYCSPGVCGWWHPTQRHWHHDHRPSLYLRIF